LQTRIIIPQDTKQSRKKQKKSQRRKRRRSHSSKSEKERKKKTSSTGQAVGYSNRSKRGFVIEQNPS
jgi:hypothetical protein